MNWTKEEIESIIQATSTEEGCMQKTGQLENRYLLWRMLQAIYKRQTSDEQSSEHTKHHNAKGFAPCDAKILTSIAKNSLKYKNLTPKQCTKIVSKRMMKYAGQLVKVIKEKQAVSTQVVKVSTQVVATEDDFNQKWAQHKNEFAQKEIEQEQAAFLRGMQEELKQEKKAAYLHKMPLM